MTADELVERLRRIRAGVLYLEGEDGAFAEWAISEGAVADLDALISDVYAERAAPLLKAPGAAR